MAQVPILSLRDYHMPPNAQPVIQMLPAHIAEIHTIVPAIRPC
jgi:hypothetical protein